MPSSQFNISFCVSFANFALNCTSQEGGRLIHGFWHLHWHCWRCFRFRRSLYTGSFLAVTPFYPLIFTTTRCRIDFFLGLLHLHFSENLLFRELHGLFVADFGIVEIKVIALPCKLLALIHQLLFLLLIPILLIWSAVEFIWVTVKHFRIVEREVFSTSLKFALQIKLLLNHVVIRIGAFNTCLLQELMLLLLETWALFWALLVAWFLLPASSSFFQQALNHFLLVWALNALFATLAIAIRAVFQMELLLARNFLFIGVSSLLERTQKCWRRRFCNMCIAGLSLHRLLFNEI